MNITEIYNTFTIGSQGFVMAVVDHCGYELSNEQIEEIAAISETPEEFEENWKEGNYSF